MEKKKNYFHILREFTLQPNPEHYAFFDTETEVVERKKWIDDEGYEMEEETQKLKLGWVIFWNRKTDETVKKQFKTGAELWDMIEEEIKQHDLYLMAHNSEFDVKVSDGYRELFIKRLFKLEKVYIQGMVYMLECSKHGNLLRIHDTANYAPIPLKDIGDAVGIPKKLICFSACSEKELSEYCLNDVEICHAFIKQFINFMEQNDLGRIRATMGSCAMGAYRTRFYKRKNQPIHIHAHTQCIDLERRSYKGGVTDCLQVGHFTGRQYKTDVNSMYPYVMQKYDSPVKMLYYLTENHADMMRRLKIILRDKQYLAIAEVTINLPSTKAFLLTPFIKDGEQKNGFIHGTFRTTLTTPELEFVQTHGSIQKVHRLAIYQKANIFREYIQFFYDKRKTYRDKKSPDYNPCFALICKNFMNVNYGKWGQKDTETEEIPEISRNIGIGKKDIHELGIGNAYKKYTLLNFGHTIIKLEKNNNNAHDSFVAIASHVTAYARMYLIEMIMKAGRENVYYCDTDSIITNAAGMEKLKPYLDDTELGKLKLEDEANEATYIKPKYYKFNVLKCKGVKKKERDTQGNVIRTTLKETPEEWIIKQQQFEKMKTSFARGTFGEQRIYMQKKKISKKYDKGHIEKGGLVKPYHSSQVKVGKLEDQPKKQKTALKPAENPLNEQVDKDQFDHAAYADPTLTQAEQKWTKEQAIKNQMKG